MKTTSCTSQRATVNTYNKQHIRIMWAIFNNVGTLEINTHQRKEDFYL